MASGRRCTTVARVEIFNLHGDEWDATEEHEGFASREAEVGARIAAELIGGSL